MKRAAQEELGAEARDDVGDEQEIALLRAMLELSPAERLRESQRLWNW